MLPLNKASYTHDAELARKPSRARSLDSKESPLSYSTNIMQTELERQRGREREREREREGARKYGRIARVYLAVILGCFARHANL